jgi:hypothetical protein
VIMEDSMCDLLARSLASSPCVTMGIRVRDKLEAKGAHGAVTFG